MPVPNKIFIVPYRQRESQKALFLQKMQQEILVDEQPDSYEIVFAHQRDLRPFNRGAMKNIGFLAMKQKYPQNYQQITFIFHDVDTFPSEKGMVKYDTVQGTVAHFFGYEFALGGMFAIKGCDFERAGGFPNFWGWGLEDNTLQERCVAAGLKIDRSNFYDIKDPRIIRPFDGFQRVISKRDSVVYKFEKPDGLFDVKNLKYTLENEFIHVQHFDVMMNPREQVFEKYDIRRGSHIPIPQGFNRRVWSMRKMLA